MKEQNAPSGGAGRGGDGEDGFDAAAAGAAVSAVGSGLSEAARGEFVRLFQAGRSRFWLIAAAVTADRTEADDVLQDAAMIGLAKFTGFVPGTSFDAWMGQITRNVALNAMRKRNRAAGKLSQHAMMQEPEAAGASYRDGEGTEGGREHGRMAGQGDRLDRLGAAVAGLDDVARTCLLLRVVGGLSYQTISAILLIPESTAMSHVYRSRGHLRRWLMGGEMEPSWQEPDNSGQRLNPPASSITGGQRVPPGVVR